MVDNIKDGFGRGHHGPLVRNSDSLPPHHHQYRTLSEEERIEGDQVLDIDYAYKDVTIVDDPEWDK